MKRKRKTNIKRITGLVIILISIGVICFLGVGAIIRITREKPEDLIVKYMAHIEKQEYDAMYSMIDPKSSYIDGKEAYIERNSKIYEGIELSLIHI